MLASINRIFKLVQIGCEGAEKGFYPEPFGCDNDAYERTSWRIVNMLVWDLQLPEEGPGLDAPRRW